MVSKCGYLWIYRVHCDIVGGGGSCFHWMSASWKEPTYSEVDEWGAHNNAKRTFLITNVGTHMFQFYSSFLPNKNMKICKYPKKLCKCPKTIPKVSCNFL